MTLFSRTALTALLASAALVVVASQATAAPASLTVSPRVVHAGEPVTATIKCQATDLFADVRIRGNGIDAGGTVPLLLGHARLVRPVPADAPHGRYRVTLTCKSSNAKAAATVTVAS